MNILTVIPVFLPIAAGLAVYFIKFESAKARGIFTFAATLVNALLVWYLILSGVQGKITLIDFTGRLSFSFSPDGMGKIFAALSSSLWPLTALYSIGYMKNEERTGMFYAFFLISFGVTEGIAFSSNILTMYLFYELLTLSTIPLVIHGMKKRDVHAAKKYMIYSFGGAALAFTGVAYLIYSERYDFVLGGGLETASGDNTLALVIFVITFIGFGVKAAIFPFSSWLPTASVAPTPVTALLHSVAVVKAGAFAVIRLIYYSFGTEILYGTWAQNTVMLLSAFTVLYGSAMAVKQTHFKRRLVYSTVANLSYILFAASLMTDGGLLAASIHIVFHSVIKIGAFFVAGTVMQYAGREYIDTLNGIGKKMPVSFACFTVFTLSLTGIPPFNGFISKWFIANAALKDATAFSVIGVVVLLVSALLTLIYMSDIVIRAFFSKKGNVMTQADVKKAPAVMTVPVIISAALCLLSGIFGGELAGVLKGVLGI